MTVIYKQIDFLQWKLSLFPTWPVFMFMILQTVWKQKKIKHAILVSNIVNSLEHNAEVLHSTFLRKRGIIKLLFRGDLNDIICFVLFHVCLITVNVHMDATPWDMEIVDTSKVMTCCLSHLKNFMNEWYAFKQYWVIKVWVQFLMFQWISLYHTHTHCALLANRLRVDSLYQSCF